MAMFLPVVTRELRVRARMPSTAWVRAGAALGLLILSGPTAWFLLRDASQAGGGKMLFQLVSWVLLLFALLEGIRISAGVISDERRDGTLGLLFLTDLGPLDILLGKLAGAGLTTLYGLLATLPVLAIAVLAGGITGGELVRTAVALLNALLLALAAGLWASARARETWTAMLTALGILLALVTVPPVFEVVAHGLRPAGIDLGQLTVGLASPVLALNLTEDAAFGRAPMQFWLSQLLQPALAAGLVASAGSQLRRTWREAPAHPAAAAPRSDAGSRPPPDAAPAPEAQPRDPAPSRNRPADALAAGLTRRIPLRLWGAVLLGLSLLPLLSQWVFLLQMGNGTGGGSPLTAGLAALIQIPAVLAGLAGTLLLAHLAVRALGDARQAGELELLLVTPVPAPEIVRILGRHLRWLVIGLTSLKVVSAGAYQFFASLIRPGQGPSGPLGDDLAWMAWAQLVAAALNTWFGSLALVRVGLWMGLKQRRPFAAVGWTFGLVGILTPMAIQVVSIPLFLRGGLINPNLSIMRFFPVLHALLMTAGYLLWIRWADLRLARSFRAAAAGGP